MHSIKTETTSMISLRLPNWPWLYIRGYYVFIPAVLILWMLLSGTHCQGINCSLLKNNGRL